MKWTLWWYCCSRQLVFGHASLLLLAHTTFCSKLTSKWAIQKTFCVGPTACHPLLDILNIKMVAIFFNQSDLECTTPPFFGSGDFSKLQIADSHSKSGFDKNVSKPDGPNESICWKFLLFEIALNLISMCKFNRQVWGSVQAQPLDFGDICKQLQICHPRQ